MAGMGQLVLDTLEERNFSISLKLLQHYPATIDVLNIIAGSDHIADMVYISLLFCTIFIVQHLSLRFLSN